MTRRLMPALLASLLVAGCASPYQWRVRQEASPDPFEGQGAFRVAETNFTAVRVGKKAESEYLSRKTREEQAAWADDKVAMNSEFENQLARDADGYGIQTTAAQAPFARARRTLPCETDSLPQVTGQARPLRST